MANVLLLVMIGAMTAPLILTAVSGDSSYEKNPESVFSDLQVVQGAAMEMTDLPTMAQPASEAPLGSVGPITQTPP